MDGQTNRADVLKQPGTTDLPGSAGHHALRCCDWLTPSPGEPIACPVLHLPSIHAAECLMNPLGVSGSEAAPPFPLIPSERTFPFLQWGPGLAGLVIHPRETAWHARDGQPLPFQAISRRGTFP